MDDGGELSQHATGDLVANHLGVFLGVLEAPDVCFSVIAEYFGDDDGARTGIALDVGRGPVRTDVPRQRNEEVRRPGPTKTWRHTRSPRKIRVQGERGLGLAAEFFLESSNHAADSPRLEIDASHLAKSCCEQGGDRDLCERQCNEWGLLHRVY
jgi:hypothetical protein